MRGTGRGRLNDEGGFISASLAIGIALVALIIYIVSAGFSGATDQFGSVPVPGKSTIELPKGTIDIYYAEGTDPDAGIDLVVPSDLKYTVFDPPNTYVHVEIRGGEGSKETDNGLATVIGEMKTPFEGTYTIESESNDAQQRITPALTFGEGKFDAIKDRLDDVIDTLKGPVGILALLVIVILIFIPRYRRARQKRVYKDMP